VSYSLPVSDVSSQIHGNCVCRVAFPKCSSRCTARWMFYDHFRCVKFCLQQPNIHCQRTSDPQIHAKPAAQVPFRPCSKVHAPFPMSKIRPGNTTTSTRNLVPFPCNRGRFPRIRCSLISTAPVAGFVGRTNTDAVGVTGGRLGSSPSLQSSSTSVTRDLNLSGNLGLSVGDLDA